MKHTLSLSLLLAASSAFADTGVADSYDSASAVSMEAIALAARCIPSTTESDYLKMLKDAGPIGLVSRKPADRLKPYLLVNARRAYCVAVSDQGYPILPLEAFDATIGFSDMPADDERRLRSSLALQIGRTGTAQALVKYDKGNAWILTYVLIAPRPTKIFYHAALVKAGEYDEKRFETVATATGNMSLVSRGQAEEGYKPLFEK